MNREPVITAAAIQAALVAIVNVARAFGWVTVTDEQMSTVNASLAVVLPLLFAVLVRGTVTPTESPRIPEGSTVTTTDPATGAVTGTTTV